MASTAPQAALDIRNVLIATDFSACSNRALLHAIAAARHFGSTLHVAHVVRPMLFSFCAPEGYMGVVESELRVSALAHRDARKIVAELLRRTHSENVRFETHVDVGLAGEMVCAEIERQHIDLAVVGTHAKKGLQHLVMGSVAEDVFRRAVCPVLTVGPRSWHSDPESVQLKHILFPTDLSAASQRAVALVQAIATDFDADVTMLHVVRSLSQAAAGDRTRVLAGIEDRMREMMNDGTAACPVHYLVRTGEVVGNVLTAIEETRADLVAFGLKAPNFYADRLPWKHAYDVICQASCPVLSLRIDATN